jgi:hypothetical protein
MRLRRAVAGTVALLLGSTLVSPAAHATGDAGTTGERVGAAPVPPPLPDPWPWPKICTAAAITSYSVHPHGDQTYVSLGGWVEPCSGTENPGALRSFTLYYGDRGYRSRYVYPIRDPESQSYTFGASGLLAAPPTAVCLISAIYRKGPDSGWAVRNACIGIDQTETGPVAAPIPVDDPRVTPLIRITGNKPNAPFCGSCL